MSGIVDGLIGRESLDRLIDGATLDDDLLQLVKEAFDRFTDNDMQPPNDALQLWIDRAKIAIQRAEGNR